MINRGMSYRHYILQDELTENTLINQIFKTVLLILLLKSKQQQIRMKIKKLLLIMEHVITIKLSGAIFNKVTFNRLNSAYKPVFQLAKLFYQNQQPGVGKGEEYTFTFLIPLHELFELTVYRIISKAFEETNYEILYQKPRKYLDNQSRWVQLKPDITLMHEDKRKVLAIVDAKYKLPIIDEKWNPGTSDIYQMLAYAVRYQCNNIYMVYPSLQKTSKTSEQDVNEITINVEGRNVIIRLLDINLTTENYKELEDRLSDSLLSSSVSH